MEDLTVFKGKTVLITGDTGFKGSWLAIWMLYLGAKVIGYGLAPKTERDNYVVCDLKNKYEHINANILEFDKIYSTIKTYKPDFVFHLAAQSLVIDSYHDPMDTFNTNIMGTVNLMEAVRKSEAVKTVILVTSDKCYQNQEWIYGYRENDPLGGKDPYSASKAACEIVAQSYFESFFDKPEAANIASVRAGNVIGGGDWSKNRIIPDCINSFERKSAIKIRNPYSIRPWQYVLEPLGGYLSLASHLYRDKSFSGPWNFAPKYENMITVKELVDLLIEYWGGGSLSVDDGIADLAETITLRLDISKAINLLNWHPVLNINKSIEFTVSEYKVSRLKPEAIFEQRIEHIKKYYEIRNNAGR